MSPETMLVGLVIAGFLWALFTWIRRGKRPAVPGPATDPGPLDDAGLRAALRSPYFGGASKTKDRVQDAFERLIRERNEARRS